MQAEDTSQARRPNLKAISARFSALQFKKSLEARKPSKPHRPTTNEKILSNTHPSVVPYSERSFLAKTEICNQWREFGTCPYGDKCRFAHGEHELRTKSGGFQRVKKRKPCKAYHQDGFCYYGSRCNFLHDIPTDLQAMAKEGEPRPAKTFKKAPPSARLSRELERRLSQRLTPLDLRPNSMPLLASLFADADADAVPEGGCAECKGAICGGSGCAPPPFLRNVSKPSPPRFSRDSSPQTASPILPRAAPLEGAAAPPRRAQRISCPPKLENADAFPFLLPGDPGYPVGPCGDAA